MIHLNTLLESSALESVEGRVWAAHTTITSRGCQHFPLLSALWLVDSDAVSLRCARTRDPMMIFDIFSGSSSVVHPAVYPVFSWLSHVHSWISAHLKPWTAQDVITLCSSYSCLTYPNSFVSWKTLGSGDHFSVGESPFPHCFQPPD